MRKPPPAAEAEAAAASLPLLVAPSAPTTAAAPPPTTTAGLVGEIGPAAPAGCAELLETVPDGRNDDAAVGAVAVAPTPVRMLAPAAELTAGEAAAEPPFDRLKSALPPPFPDEVAY